MIKSKVENIYYQYEESIILKKKHKLQIKSGTSSDSMSDEEDNHEYNFSTMKSFMTLKQRNERITSTKNKFNKSVNNSEHLKNKCELLQQTCCRKKQQQQHLNLNTQNS